MLQIHDGGIVSPGFQGQGFEPGGRQFWPAGMMQSSSRHFPVAHYGGVVIKLHECLLVLLKTAYSIMILSFYASFPLLQHRPALR
jgi:hypothetical protein